MTLRTMNDVRKWLLGVVNGETQARSVNYIEGRYSTAIELLNLIGRDAAPDAWEEMADNLAWEVETLCDGVGLTADDADTILSEYRKLKEESRGTSS